MRVLGILEHDEIADFDVPPPGSTRQREVMFYTFESLRDTMTDLLTVAGA